MNHYSHASSTAARRSSAAERSPQSFQRRGPFSKLDRRTLANCHRTLSRMVRRHDADKLEAYYGPVYWNKVLAARTSGTDVPSTKSRQIADGSFGREHAYQ